MGKIASLVKIKGFGLKEKRLSRSVFFFFTAGSRPIRPVQFLYLRLAFIQKGIAPGAKRLQIEHKLHSESINERKLLDTVAKTNIIAVSVVNFSMMNNKR